MIFHIYITFFKFQEKTPVKNTLNLILLSPKKPMPEYLMDISNILIIGCGRAGLRAAIEAKCKTTTLELIKTS